MNEWVNAVSFLCLQDREENFAICNLEDNLNKLDEFFSLSIIFSQMFTNIFVD